MSTCNYKDTIRLNILFIYQEFLLSQETIFCLIVSVSSLG